MKDQLRLLIELQVHDAKIQELETSLQAFPAKLEAMQADVRRVEALLERERTQLGETESWRKRQEEEARDQEDALIRARQRSQLVKNVKEHMANERELEVNRRNAAAREEEAARLATAVDSAKKALGQHEVDLQTMKDHVAEQEAEARAQMAAIEKHIAAARTEREVSAARVEATALKRYGTIRMRRGLALAAVRAGTCLGCHMNIPPQLFNTLQRGTSIEVCPTCNRIIYWDKLLADPDGEVAEKVERKVDKPKAERKPRAAKAPVLPSRPPPPDERQAPRGPLAAPAGSEPGAAGLASADTLRSSSDAAPDTATGPTTADEDAAAEAGEDEPGHAPTV